MAHSRQILWVDDEIDLLRPHIKLLQARGYSVETVTNGEDAIALVREKSFDLVFLDPPYDLPPAQVAAVLQALVPTLVEDAVVVLEQATRSGEPELPSDLELERTKLHGDTAVHWLARRSDG